MLGQRDQQELKLRLTGIWDVCVCVLSCILLFAILWTVALQAPLSMEFSRQEYWHGLPFPSLRNLPSPGIKPMPPAVQTDFLPLSHLGSSNKKIHFSFLNQEKGK